MDIAFRFWDILTLIFVLDMFVVFIRLLFLSICTKCFINSIPWDGCSHYFHRLHSTYSHRLFDYLSIILLFSGHIHGCLCVVHQPLECNSIFLQYTWKMAFHHMHTAHSSTKTKGFSTNAFFYPLQFHISRMREIFFYLNCSTSSKIKRCAITTTRKNCVYKWKYFHNSKHLWKLPCEVDRRQKMAHINRFWGKRERKRRVKNDISIKAVYWCLWDSDV